jgi:hypothetical protein
MTRFKVDREQTTLAVVLAMIQLLDLMLLQEIPRTLIAKTSDIYES